MGIYRTTLPQASMLSQSKYDYADSFAGTFTDSNQKTKAAAVGKAFFTSGPKWIEKLFALRNAIVRFFGLKTLTISTTVQFNNRFGKLYFFTRAAFPPPHRPDHAQGHHPAD